MTTTSFSVATGDYFPATLEFVDAFGNKSLSPEGTIPVWSVDNGAILIVTPSADGMSANIATVGPVGMANVSVIDTTTSLALTGELQVTVETGTVVSINIVPGTPVV